MDKSEKSGGKRNHKNQKNKQKIEEKGNLNTKDETVKKPVTNTTVKEPEPQPQRTNRRNRSEVTNNVSSDAVSSPKVPVLEKRPEAKVEVDHSNLKRETEEIAKLTKKFTKREISSNWHRYSAPENVDNETTVEYGAPADFSDLIQISASRGGHLQLKEEQDWSSVSGAELGGYFALDLRTLNQGLACIPAHERLRIPCHVLTDDVVGKFNDESKKALATYKPYADYSDPKNQTLKLLTNLIKSDDDSEENVNSETPLTNREETFNILDIETSRKKLVDLSLDPATSFEEQQMENDVSENTASLKSNPNIVKHDDVALTFEEPKPMRIRSNDSKASKEDSSWNSAKVSQTQTIQSSETDKENILDRKLGSTNESKIKDPNSFNKQNISDMKSVTMEELRKPSKPSNTMLDQNKTEQKANVPKNLEDDDDLDFLLSLKAPIKVVKPVETSSAPVKEVSILPSKSKGAQPTSNATSSDLDDWLDSVLQD